MTKNSSLTQRPIFAAGVLIILLLLVSCTSERVTPARSNNEVFPISVVQLIEQEACSEACPRLQIFPTETSASNEDAPLFDQPASLLRVNPNVQVVVGANRYFQLSHSRELITFRNEIGNVQVVNLLGQSLQTFDTPVMNEVHSISFSTDETALVFTSLCVGGADTVVSASSATPSAVDITATVIEYCLYTADLASGSIQLVEDNLASGFLRWNSASDQLTVRHKEGYIHISETGQRLADDNFQHESSPDRTRRVEIPANQDALLVVKDGHEPENIFGTHSVWFGFEHDWASDFEQLAVVSPTSLLHHNLNNGESIWFEFETQQWVGYFPAATPDGAPYHSFRNYFYGDVQLSQDTELVFARYFDGNDYEIIVVAPERQEVIYSTNNNHPDSNPSWLSNDILFYLSADVAHVVDFATGETVSILIDPNTIHIEPLATVVEG